MYEPEFDPDWKEYFERLPNEIKPRITKKMRQILRGLPGRHLRKGLPYFVEEVGQYRIAYRSFEDRQARRFYFVGNHKDYEAWYSGKI